jgi:hypothetical protein
MKKFLVTLLLIGLPFAIFAGDILNPHTGEMQKITDFREDDGSPTIYAPETIIVSNGTLTNYGNQTGLIDTSGTSTTGWTDDGTTVRLTTSTDKVGIGTTSPLFKLHVVDTDAPVIIADQYSGSADTGFTYAPFLMRAARGTPSSPVALKTGDIMFSLSARGYYGSDFTSLGRAVINGHAAEDWTSSAQGTYLAFRVTPIGSTSIAEVVRFDEDGSVGIGDITPDHKLDVAGNIGLTASGYINWGDTDGTSGYGFRDNAGTIEFKNSGGAWATFSGAVAGADTQVQFNNSGAFGASADFTFNDTTDLLTLAGPIKADLFYNTSVVSFTDGDTTPTVGAGNSFVTANTGATSITNFDDGQAGQYLHIVFGDANTTLVHNVTKINLTSDSNWNFATNDAILLIKKGTVWYEVGRGGGGSGTVTGTGANTRVAYWAGTNTLSSDSAFTYTASTDTLTLDGNYIGGGNIRFNSVSNASAPTVALAGAGAGNVDDGAHTYVVTFVTAVGETSGVNTATVTVVDQTSDGKVSITNIPTSTNALVTSRKIYRSTAGTTTPLYYHSTIANNTTTTATDNTADASLGTAVPPGQYHNTSSGWWLNDATPVMFIDNVNFYAGYQAGIANKSGNYLTAIGVQAGYNHISGNQDTYIGGYSGYAARTTSGGNTGIGSNSLYYEEGLTNTAVGAQAFQGDSTFYGTNSYSDCIGYNTFSRARRISYSGALGARAGENYQVGTGFLFAGYFSNCVRYPSTGPTVALAGLGAGNLSNGKYYYKVTYVLTVSGSSIETQPCTQSPTVTVTDNSTDGQVAVSSIPTYSGGFTCTARKLYRTTAGGLTLKLLDTIADNTTTTYADNVADASLGPYAEVIGTGQLVLGGIDATYLYYLGGVEDTYSRALNLNVCNKYGTNVTSSTDLNIYASSGTGTGSGADIVFYTYPAGASGSAFNTAVEILRFDTSSTRTIFNDTGADWDYKIEGDTDTVLFTTDAGTDSVAIGVQGSGDGKFEVQTSSTWGGQSFTIDQDDSDQPFIDYQGTSAANANNSISTWTTGNAVQGFIRIEINGSTFWMPYYNAPTS